MESAIDLWTYIAYSVFSSWSLDYIRSPRDGLKPVGVYSPLLDSRTSEHHALLSGFYITVRKCKKVKLSLCLTKHHAMKTYWGSGSGRVAPRILDLGTRWKWVSCAVLCWRGLATGWSPVQRVSPKRLQSSLLHKYSGRKRPEDLISGSWRRRKFSFFS
jgi:hypothetical protein